MDDTEITWERISKDLVRYFRDERHIGSILNVGFSKRLIVNGKRLDLPFGTPEEELHEAIMTLFRLGIGG